MRRSHTIITILVTATAALLLLAGSPSTSAHASDITPDLPFSAGLQQGVGNEACLACHRSPDLQLTLPSGEVLDLTVQAEEYENSVHGQHGYACVQCHTEIEGYPHPEMRAASIRDWVVSEYQACARCHQDKYQATLDSVHQKQLAAGNFEAAVCTDCHGNHAIQPPGEPRTQIPQTCRKCHSAIFDVYAESVHGEALLGEGNPDVPSCIDCHGVHSIEGPSNSEFRLFSPQICARCHANDELMQKYVITTDVFDTYVSDFHGTVVTLYQQVTEGQEINAPVCIDCHGVHDIQQVESPDSPVLKENLVQTCQKCHPDASTNFPGAWMSHYRPSPEHWPLVYFVNVFYKIFIPTVIGGMLLFVSTDVARRVTRRRPKDEHSGE